MIVGIWNVFSQSAGKSEGNVRCSDGTTKNILISDIREQPSSDWWLQHPQDSSNKWRPIIGSNKGCTTRHNHIDGFKIKVFAVLTMNFDERGYLDHQRQMILNDCNNSTVGKNNTKKNGIRKSKAKHITSKDSSDSLHQIRKILEV
jgi:hypothetical protein